MANRARTYRLFLRVADEAVASEVVVVDEVAAVDQVAVGFDGPTLPYPKSQPMNPDIPPVFSICEFLA